jgi:predicted dehydrogenase
MPQPLKIAVVGTGRMGAVHALHAHELATETGDCRLVALVDSDLDCARRVAGELGSEAEVFSSISDLIRSGTSEAAIVVTPTANHRQDASQLVEAGHRVLLEKPLTGTIDSDREFSAQLDRLYPDALMLAFQRRFDAPLQYVKQLMESGLIGRIFKIYSALEDSGPAPDWYQSNGLLADMSVHNVDEILWLTGAIPHSALAIGSRLYSHRLTACQEDFDDALLYLWFDNQMTAQVQVSRNHVSGYRVETIIFGEEGQIHVGRFEQKFLEVVVEAYARRESREPLVHRVFSARNYRKPLPEFIDRFGAAYKTELATFIDACRTSQPFPVTHRDGLRAQEVISAGMRSVVAPGQAAQVVSVCRD